MRILVIEDDEAIRSVLERGLRAEGFDVDACADGPSGLWKGLESGGAVALWAGDAATARELTVRIEASLIRGQAIGLDLATLRAGVAALDGRRAEAIAGYRDVLRGWRQLDLAFDEALAALDMAILLAPTAGEMAEAPAAIDWTRETLTRLRAAPLLERLDEATAGVAAKVPTDAAGAVRVPSA